jgi:hypothetical protein
LIFFPAIGVHDVCAGRVVTSFINSAIWVFCFCASWVSRAVLVHSSVLVSLFTTASAHAILRGNFATIT